MKKIFIFLTAAAMALTLASCGAENKANDHKSLLKEAEELHTSMDLEEASRIYNHIIEEDPEETEAYKGLSEVYVTEKDYEKAKEVLETGYEETQDEDLDDELYDVTCMMAYEEFPEADDNGVDTAVTGADIPYTDAGGGLLSSVTDDFDGDGSPEMLNIEYFIGDYSTEARFTLTLMEADENGDMDIIDSRTVDRDLYTNAEFELFMKDVDGRKYLFINSCSDHFFNMIGTLKIIEGVYEISGDGIEKECVTRFFTDEDSARYALNGESIYEYDTGDFDEYNDDLEYVTEEGMELIRSSLEEYGIDRSRIVESDEIYGPEMLWCDDSDETEMRLCYIRNTVMEDRTILDFTGTTMDPPDYEEEDDHMEEDEGY